MKVGGMPKETIYDNASMWDIQVNWIRPHNDFDGDVQVGIESHDRRTLIGILVGDAIPREQLDKMLGNGDLPAFTGLWGSLDRDRINHLIRLLRRARDSAYGADA